MKLVMLSFSVLTCAVMASAAESTMSSRALIARSLFSIDTDDLHRISPNIIRRTSQPPLPAKVFSPSILRAQDATAASERRPANAVTQRATNPLATTISTAPISPPASPRTAGHRADAAERIAEQARTNFHTVNQENIWRANLIAPVSHRPSPHDDLINGMTHAEWQNVAAGAKQEQALVYAHAANAARKAGRRQRYIRNNQKAEASQALAQSHYASVDLTKIEAIQRFEERKHTAWVASHPNHPGGETGSPHYASLQQSRILMETARNRKTGAAEEARRLQNLEGGRDTQSSSSGSE